MQFSRRGLLSGIAALCADRASGGTIPLLGAGGSSSPSPGGGLTIDFLTSTFDLTDLSTYTFAAQPLGTASADRKIVVGISARAGTPITVNSLTVAGVAATPIANVASGAGSINRTAMFLASVPNGTTGDVVAVLSTTAARCAIGLWSIKGNAALAGASDSGTSIADPATATLNVPANGGAIGYGFDASAGPATWTGMTEDFDEIIETVQFHTGAHMTSVGGGSTLFECDWANAPANGAGAVFATFGP